MTDARSELLALAADLEAEAATFTHAARRARERADALAAAESTDACGPDAERRPGLERAVWELAAAVAQFAARLDERGHQPATRPQRDPSSTTGARVDAAPQPPRRQWHRQGQAPAPPRAEDVGFGRPR